MLRPSSSPQEPEPLASKRYRNCTKDDNKHRTEKARISFLLSRQAARLNQKSETNASASGNGSFAAKLQRWFFTKSFWNADKQEDVYSQDNRDFRRDRKRSLYSYIHRLVAVLKQVFGSSSWGEFPPFHVVNSHVVDDTSTKMRGPCAKTDRLSTFTVMNTVQTLHVRRGMDISDGQVFENSCSENFRIPTPLMILENANAKGIYGNFTAGAVATARGVGSMLIKFGLPQRLIPDSSWVSFVFCGDALKANAAAYREECKEMARNKAKNIGSMRHIAIKLRCSIHQLCLIRKPVVLMLPRVWTTLVRLSHLFETMSFRKGFARALTAIIQQNFQFMEVTALPEASKSWRVKSDWLRGSFRCQSKLRRETFESCLDFLNGDLDSDVIWHFCINNGHGQCCESREEALTKIIKMLVPFCSRGYQVPLLYRFKHYDEAVSYITFVSSIHNLLARTLNRMDISSSTASDNEYIDRLLAEIDLGNEGPGTEAVAFQEDHLDESFHLVNSKRKQQVHQEVMKHTFRQSVLTIDLMIAPMDTVMNRLFKRSRILAHLSLVGKHDPNWKTQVEASQKTFMSLVSGRFGWDIIQIYCNMWASIGTKLGEMGLEHSASLSTVLTMIIVIISDTWRRFVHDFCSYPWKLFELLGVTDLDTFVAEFEHHQRAKHDCPQCFDAEFSHRLLDAFPEKLSDQPLEIQKSAFNSITLILHDLATYSPISSDAVECKNGQVQAATCRRGFGKGVKAPESAKETSFLQTIVRDYELVKHWIQERTLPPKKTLSGILRRCGLKGSNQFSRPSKPVPFHTFQQIWLRLTGLTQVNDPLH